MLAPIARGAAGVQPGETENTNVLRGQARSCLAAPDGMIRMTPSATLALAFSLSMDAFAASVGTI
ncbi:MAG: hypothetical protein JWM77_1187 [Rhodospirillales bacterium]|nr:hypothetical protein [Rhodospirillales bacterium]